MANLERKIIIDTSDIDRADKEFDKLAKETDKDQKSITNSAKRESNKRDAIVRNTLAKKIKRIRRASNKRVSLLKQTLDKNLISEQKHAKKVEKIQAKSRAKIAKERAKGGGAKLSGLAKGLIGGVIVAGATKAIKALSNLASGAIDVSNKLESFNRRAKVVFGESLPLVELAAENAAASMALTRAEFIATASATADLLIPLGATRAQAAEMSTTTLELAAALKEFNGDQRSTAEVAQVLTKSFLGEREGLKSLGISINEASIKQKLLERGTSGLTGKALELEKALITQELLLSKSTDAMTAYADSTGSGQQESNKLSAEWKELVQTGNQLIAGIFGPLVAGFAALIRGINATIRGFKLVFNIANARNKQRVQGILLVQQLQKELLKLSKIRGKTPAEIKREQKVRSQLVKAINSQKNASASLLLNNKALISNAKNLVNGAKKSARTNLIKNKSILKVTNSTLKLVLAERKQLKSSKDLFLKQKRLSQNQASIDRLTKEALNLKKDITADQQILAAGKKSQSASIKVSSVRIGRAPKQAKQEKQEFVREDTTLEEQIAQAEVIQERLKQIELDGLQGRFEQEALLNEEKRLDELINAEEQAITLDTLESEREAIRESLADERSKKEIKRLKESLKLKKIEIKAFLAIENQKTKIIASNEAIRAKIENIGFELGQALLSQEEGAFRKFLANQFRAFANFLAKKASIEAGLALASQNFAKAALLTAAAIGIKLVGEAGGRAIEGDQTQTTVPDFGGAVVPSQPIPEGTSVVNNTTINNIDNSVNVEVIETGTYFTESQMIRDRISPLLQQLDDSRGALQQ